MFIQLAISLFILTLSGCSLFTDPSKLEKIESDLAGDAIQIIEDIQNPSPTPTPQKGEPSNAH